MSVELTPKGTYGQKMSKVLRMIIRAMMGFGVVAYRIFGKRMRIMGRPLLLLTTVGAKSGRYRRTILGWFPNSEGTWLVVASNAGSARHPAWYFNMVKNPDHVWIEVGGRKVKVRPQSLKGNERAEAWKGVVTLAPGYRAYQQKTDREIPVIRLEVE